MSDSTFNLPAKNSSGFSPRVIFFRHGETAWSLTGQHTSFTDLPLTENGECRVRSTGKALIGPDRLVDLRNVEKIFCSPRKRARRTLELLFDNCTEQPDPKPVLVETTKENVVKKTPTNVPIEFTEEIREWDYGLYEGLVAKEINRWRIKKGLNLKISNTDKDHTESDYSRREALDSEQVPLPDPSENLHESEYRCWSIWRDGCEGGETSNDVCGRIDKLIQDIITIQQQAIAEGRPGDVVLVAHGHILRALSMRWLKLPLDNDPEIKLLLEAGGSGVLSYEHSSWNERAINLGGAFTVPNETR